MTILSESTKNGIVTLLVFIAIIGVCLAVIGAICDSNFLAVVGSVLFVIFGIYAAIQRSDLRTEYKVLINDTYTVNELYESYEIVGREGEMYILRAKEDKEDGDM